MAENPAFDSPNRKTDSRHTSITTIADNVKSDDSASLSSKGSNSTSVSLVNIHVKPADPDNRSILVDRNSNEIGKSPDEKEKYLKEVPQSKVRYYKPNPPVDAKPRQLTQCYKYFSGPPPKFRDYKYKEYIGKNNDIPKYKPYKYREYTKYREYKLTHWNTFWLGGYKAPVKKPYRPKPKVPARPKKPLKKIGILSAHSLFYPYHEFDYRPYEKWRDYKYKEYSKYREYKGRQVPLSTLYNLIGIWRPIGTKPPIPWQKSKIYDPKARTLLPPEPKEKIFDPPFRQIQKPVTSETPQLKQDSKFYNPPQRTMIPPDNAGAPEEKPQEVKVYSPPKKELTPLLNEEPTYTEETKVLVLPQKVFVVPVGVSQQPLPDPVAIPYAQETRTFEPNSKQMPPPVEYFAESKEHDLPTKQMTAPREYVAEEKYFDPRVKEKYAPREYKEEAKFYDPPSAKLVAPIEYTPETKLMEMKSKQISGPAEQTIVQPPVIIPQESHQHVYLERLPENVPQYKPEQKALVLEKKTKILEEPIVPVYEVESKMFNPAQKSVAMPPSTSVLNYSEERKTVIQPEKKSVPVIIAHAQESLEDRPPVIETQTAEAASAYPREMKAAENDEEEDFTTESLNQTPISEYPLIVAEEHTPVVAAAPNRAQIDDKIHEVKPNASQSPVNSPVQPVPSETPEKAQSSQQKETTAPTLTPPPNPEPSVQQTLPGASAAPSPAKTPVTNVQTSTAAAAPDQYKTPPPNPETYVQEVMPRSSAAVSPDKTPVTNVEPSVQKTVPPAAAERAQTPPPTAKSPVQVADTTAARAPAPATAQTAPPNMEPPVQKAPPTAAAAPAQSPPPYAEPPVQKTPSPAAAVPAQSPPQRTELLVQETSSKANAARVPNQTTSTNAEPSVYEAASRTAEASFPVQSQAPHPQSASPSLNPPQTAAVIQDAPPAQAEQPFQETPATKALPPHGPPTQIATNPLPLSTAGSGQSSPSVPSTHQQPPRSPDSEQTTTAPYVQHGPSEQAAPPPSIANPPNYSTIESALPTPEQSAPAPNSAHAPTVPTVQPAPVPDSAPAQTAPSLQPVQASAPPAKSAPDPLPPAQPAYNGASPRTEIVEARGKKPGMNIGDSPSNTSKPKALPKTAAGSIQRTMRLLGKQ